ncbi:MAG: transporter [Eggerthellaceae bacterium]|nr:transporter [Eggerthellaceae bacterium]
MSKFLKKYGVYFALHLLLVFYSLAAVLSKFAAGVEFFSIEFILLYACIIMILAFFAIGWQQILKRMTLTAAFANKGITVVWCLIWGALIFSEETNWIKLLGALLVIVGIVLLAYFENKKKKNES